jgi:hypothetical protein
MCLGGLVMKGLTALLLRLCRVDIRVPPLLGMLIVGIFLKNVPYNFGQFGRAECFRNGSAAEFVDSLHDIDALENHIQGPRFKKIVLLNLFETVRFNNYRLFYIDNSLY